VRRDLAIALGGFDSHYRHRGEGGCEDFDFELKLAEHHRVDVVDGYLVGYRKTAGNMSSDFQQMRRSLIATITRRSDAHRRLPEHVKRWALASADLTAFWCFRFEKDWRQAARALLAVAKRDPQLAVGVLMALTWKNLLTIAPSRQQGRGPDCGRPFASYTP